MSEVKNGRYEEGDSVRWYKNDVLHREDGPAVVAGEDLCVWYFEGEYHRVGGPAIINTQEERWYQHGKLHREDGPAIEDKKNSRYNRWVIEGNELTEGKFNHWLAKKQFHDSLQQELETKQTKPKMKI